VSTDCIELQKKLEKTQAILSALHQGELDAIVRSDDVALIRNEETIRNTEHALKESQNNFQLLFDTLDDLLFIMDIKGNIKHFNITVQEVLGYETHELKSMNFLDLHKKEKHAEIHKLLRGESQIVQIELVKKNHDIIHAETRFSKGAWSQQPVWFAIVRDISIRKQAEFEMKAARKAAEEADQAKTEFFAKMTHELRTPLNGILGYSQILLKQLALNEHQKRAVSVIQSSGEYLLDLINDLLDFSTLEAHKMSINIESVALIPLIRYICEMGTIQAKQKKIGFSIDIPDKVPEIIHTDEKRLQQILLNLLGNAIKYTDQGSVHFMVSLLDNKIRFCIQDTGCGIAYNQQQFIFKAFNRIKDKTQQKEGTGLGLYISQKLLHMMNSDLNIESAEGKGTKVWFDLDIVVKSTTTSIKSEDLLYCEQELNMQQKLTYPPRHMLDLILEFTMAGDINGIFEWIDQHMNEDPAYKPFFQTIKNMALEYKITDIQQMIEAIPHGSPCKFK